MLSSTLSARHGQLVVPPKCSKRHGLYTSLNNLILTIPIILLVPTTALTLLFG